MASSCVKCSRDLEPDLEGSPSTQCLLCIGEGIDLLGMLNSMDLGGLREVSTASKCSVCTREINPGDQAVKTDHGYICESCTVFFQRNAGAPIPILLQEKEKWIVKSSLTVTGPFSEDRILNGIRAREFASLDEVCEPRRFWKYIRDTEVFTEVLRETTIKDFREDNTVDITKSMTASHFGTDPGIFSKQDSRVVDIKFDEKVLNNLPNQGQAKISIGRIPLGLALGILVLVGFFAFMAGKRNQPDVVEFSEESARSNLEVHWEKGLYNRYATEAREIELNGFELSETEKVQMAAVLVSKSDYYKANYILDSLVNPNLKKEIALVKAKIAYFEKGPEEALNILNSLSLAERADQKVLINISFLLLELGKLRESERMLPQSVSLESLNSNRAIVDLIFKIKSNYEFSKKELRELGREIEGFTDARASLDILLGILMFRKDFPAESETRFFNAISHYPDVDNSFKQDLYMIPYAARFKVLEKEFKEVRLKEASLDLAVQSLIAHKLGDNPKAVRKMEQANRTNSGTKLLEAWLQYLVNGEIQDAPSQPSPDFVSLTNPFVLNLVAEKCLKQEKLKCARILLAKVLSENERDVRARYNMVLLQEKLGNKTEALNQYRKGIGMAPRYIPLLLVEDQYL